jgi:anti-sigma regulatory factor (Ser/Thr protein kinase)
VWPTDHSAAAAHGSGAGRRVTASAFERPASERSISTRIPGGVDAPSRARRSVHAQLAGRVPPATVSDAALLVSELVTNSVVHANVGPHRALTLDLTTLQDRVRIAVTDPGSHLTPRILPPDPETAGGLGLSLVAKLCETWGVRQDLGPTSVWCELLLNHTRPRK